MHLNEYHNLALRTAKMYPQQAQNLIHAALGLSTEFMEMVTAYDPVHIKEETGDFCWYIPLACESLGFKLGDLVAENLDMPIEQATANTLQASCKLPHQGFTILPDGAKCTGDFITMVKRVAVYEKPISPEMVVQAKKDIVQMISYAAMVSNRYDLTLASVLRDNIEKLRLRFPDKFSNEAAEARADKGGADARNS